MPTYPIDLAQKSDTSYASSPTMLDNHDIPKPGEVEYPDIHLEWSEDYGLPDYGTMTIKFKKTKEVNIDKEGATKQIVELDILSIESVVAEKDEPSTKSDRETASEALDAAKEAVEGE